MSQVYDDDNNLVPVTIIEAGPCPILQVKSTDIDGYCSADWLQPSKESPPNKVNRCIKGHASKASVDSAASIKEFRFLMIHDFKCGNILTVNDFSADCHGGCCINDQRQRLSRCG